MAALVAALAGCSRQPGNTVELTVLRFDADAPITGPFRWRADQTHFRDDARGQFELLAGRDLHDPDHPIVQTLHAKVLWPIRPGVTGTDETALNARVGYLLRTDPGTPAEQARYYEGVGYVLATRAWWGGPLRFRIRRACLKLKLSRLGGAADASHDPFGGSVEIQADLVGQIVPDVGEELAAFEQSLAALRRPGDPPPAAQPDR